MLEDCLGIVGGGLSAATQMLNRNAQMFNRYAIEYLKFAALFFLGSTVILYRKRARRIQQDKLKQAKMRQSMQNNQVEACAVECKICLDF